MSAMESRTKEKEATVESQTEFGAKMVQWREDAGLTRKDFARKLSVSLTAVKNWETGHSTPKLTKYSEIAKVLGIDVREMGLDNNLDLTRIGDRIKYARLLRGMSIEAFSYEFGFAIQTVKSWESHAADVTEASLERIARALQIPPSFFDIEKDAHQELAQAS
ncbi:MAG: helix-turn-helix domain-containing protein [bacterium]|jgi:transcriptional regulator with XRE-family HTH domain